MVIAYEGQTGERYQASSIDTKLAALNDQEKRAADETAQAPEEGVWLQELAPYEAMGGSTATVIKTAVLEGDAQAFFPVQPLFAAGKAKSASSASGVRSQFGAFSRQCNCQILAFVL